MDGQGKDSIARASQRNHEGPPAPDAPLASEVRPASGGDVPGATAPPRRVEGAAGTLRRRLRARRGASPEGAPEAEGTGPSDLTGDSASPPAVTPPHPAPMPARASDAHMDTGATFARARPEERPPHSTPDGVTSETPASDDSAEAWAPAYTPQDDPATAQPIGGAQAPNGGGGAHDASEAEPQAPPLDAAEGQQGAPSPGRSEHGDEAARLAAFARTGAGETATPHTPTASPSPAQDAEVFPAPAAFARASAPADTPPTAPATGDDRPLEPLMETPSFEAPGAHALSEEPADAGDMATPFPDQATTDHGVEDGDAAAASEGGLHDARLTHAPTDAQHADAVPAPAAFAGEAPSGDTPHAPPAADGDGPPDPLTEAANVEATVPGMLGVGPADPGDMARPSPDQAMAKDPGADDGSAAVASEGGLQEAPLFAPEPASARPANVAPAPVSARPANVPPDPHDEAPPSHAGEAVTERRGRPRAQAPTRRIAPDGDRPLIAPELSRDRGAPPVSDPAPTTDADPPSGPGTVMIGERVFDLVDWSATGLSIPVEGAFFRTGERRPLEVQIDLGDYAVMIDLDGEVRARDGGRVMFRFVRPTETQREILRALARSARTGKAMAFEGGGAQAGDPPSRRRAGPLSGALALALNAAIIALVAGLVVYALNDGWPGAAAPPEAPEVVRAQYAAVAVNRLALNAPVSGQLVEWRVSEGAAVAVNDVILTLFKDEPAARTVRVHAPCNCFLSRRLVPSGTRVTAGTSLGVLYARGAQGHVQALFAEGEAPAPGRNVTVELPSTGETLSGTVVRLAPAPNPDAYIGLSPDVVAGAEGLTFARIRPEPALPATRAGDPAIVTASPLAAQP